MKTAIAKKNNFTRIGRVQTNEIYDNDEMIKRSKHVWS